LQDYSWKGTVILKKSNNNPYEPKTPPIVLIVVIIISLLGGLVGLCMWNLGLGLIVSKSEGNKN